MTVSITSTTDTPEAVTAALGDLAKGKAVEGTTSEAAPKEQVEKTEESDTSKTADAADEGADDIPDDDGDDSGDAKDDAKTDQRPKNKNGFKKRIGKLNSKIAEKDREIESLRAEVMKRAPAETKAAPAKTTASESGPKAEDFSSHLEYLEARQDWKIEQKEKAAEASRRESAVKENFQARVKTHQEKVKTFAEKHDDFSETLESVDDIPVSLAVQEAILDSDNGPELMYELAKNRKEYERICKLPALAAAREMGKFEEKLAKASETSAEKKTTKAPKPLSTVGTKAGTSTKSPDEMTFSEFKEWRKTN